VNKFFQSTSNQLLLIIILALTVRLYKINNTVLDWHAWRQADTASVTREYTKKGIDLLHPTYHDLSNIPNFLDNSQDGYRMVEFPIINALVALILKIMPNLDLVTTSRFISVALSLGTLTALYYLVKKISSEKLALLSALTFALLPFSIYYSRVVLPEPAVLLFSTSSLCFFAYYLKKEKFNFYVLSVLTLAVAFLLKPFVAFLIPVYLVLAYQKFKNKIFFKPQLYLFALLGIIPFILWRYWIQQYPEGIPDSDWLFNSTGIRFRPAWFRWLFYERLTKLILGFTGIIFFLANLLKLKTKEVQIYAAWWLGIIIYFSVIATGNVRHDYYQVLLIPIICISVARGALILFELIKKVIQNLKFHLKVSFIPAEFFFKNSGSEIKINNYAQPLSVVIISLLLLISLLLSWKQIKGYYQLNHFEYRSCGQEVDKLTPKDAKIIAHAMGDTQFLFQTNRTGWPIGFEIEDKIAKGATHYATTSFDDEAKRLEKQYETIEKTNSCLILNLQKSK